MRFDLVIKDGVIIDGTMFPRFSADIGVRRGRIEKIGSIPAGEAARVIDAKGRIVAPGVIDPHTHYDAQVLWDPLCADSSWHGATTAVVSNCGFGFAPCRPQDRERYMQMMENTEQVPVSVQRRVLSWKWETFPEWLEVLKAAPKAINLATYLPLNPLMIYVMGVDAAKSRMATKAELGRMRDMLHAALDAGACGLSFSHVGLGNNHADFDGTPMPSDIMDIRIVYDLCEVLRERGQGAIQTLVEFPGLPDYKERRAVVKEVARLSGRPTIHTLCIPSDQRPEYHKDVLAWLDECEADGVDNIVTQALLGRKWAEMKAPDWTVWDAGGPVFREYSAAGDWDAKVAKASDQAWRDRLRAAYHSDMLVGGGGALETYQLRSAHGVAELVPFEGQRLGEIAAMLGRHVTDVLFDLVAATQGQADFVVAEGTSRDPQKAADILAHKRALPGTSDGGAHVKVVNGGQYPTEMIAWLVREHGLTTLENLHYKFSHQTARLMGFEDRGVLREGYAADMMIYDYERIDFDLLKLETRFDMPDGSYRRLSRPRGIDWVIVGGEPILKDSEGTGALPGQLISNAGPAMDAKLREIASAA
jgi:N-acyl-D-amino-acid deacylase